MSALVRIAAAGLTATCIAGTAEPDRSAEARARFLAGDTSVVAELARACDPRARFGPDDAWPRTACTLLEAFRAEDVPTWTEASGVLAGLEDPDPAVRELAARHLAPMGIAAPPDRIAALLADPASGVVAATLTALAELGDGRHRDAAARRLGHADARVRLAAADYLLDPANPASVTAVLPAVDDVDERVRAGVRERALRIDRLDDLIRARLDAGEAAGDAAGRAAAWRAVATLLAGRAVPDAMTPRLADAARDPSDAVRVEAALAALPNVRDRAVLVGQGRALSDDGSLPDRWAVAGATVAAVLDDPDPARRLRAVELTTWLSVDEARAIVRRRLDGGEPDEDVAVALIQHLGTIGTAGDAERIVALGRRSTSERLQAVAVLAGARLAAGPAGAGITEWVRELLSNGARFDGRLAATGEAAGILGDPALIPDLAAALRDCPIERPWVCSSLSGAISILLGHRMHGDRFDPGEGAP